MKEENIEKENSLEDNFLDSVGESWTKSSKIPYANFKEIQLTDGGKIAITESKDKEPEMEFKDKIFQNKIQNKDIFETHLNTVMDLMVDMKKSKEYNILYPFFSIILSDGQAKHGTLYPSRSSDIQSTLFRYVSEYEDAKEISHIILASEAMAHKCRAQMRIDKKIKPIGTSRCSCTESNMKFQKAILVQSFNRTSPEKSFILAKEFDEIENQDLVFSKSEVIPMERSQSGGNWEGEDSASKFIKDNEDSGPYA